MLQNRKKKFLGLFLFSINQNFSILVQFFEISKVSHKFCLNFNSQVSYLILQYIIQYMSFSLPRIVFISLLSI